ncbi:hypothetical protein HYT55_01030 [Candidatus Woesearchaeota archaeon]|nr:hypothetical protein [Candidatus Woesearchaeota archaeon]
MGDIFLRLLNERFPQCRISQWVELPTIYRNPYERPSFPETQQIAGQELRGLEYTLQVVEFRGEMSSPGDFFLSFPRPAHFMILSRLEGSYAAVINIGWRGRPVMTEEEREKYCGFLQRYFRV